MAVLKDLIDYNDVTGMYTYFVTDDQDERSFYLEHVQEVAPLLDANKQLQIDPEHKRNGIKQGWQHIASIPDILVYKWLREENIDVFNPEHMPAVKRKLRDPAYRYLRATLGNI